MHIARNMVIKPRLLILDARPSTERSHLFSGSNRMIDNVICSGISCSCAYFSIANVSYLKKNDIGIALAYMILRVES